MFQPVPSPYLVPFDDTFRVRDARTSAPDDAPKKKKARELLAEQVARIDRAQELLYARDSHSLLLIFQAMDAAGKDGVIRAVLTGVNPAGCQVYSFKKPSALEIDHDFLWRTAISLPERGRFGVFNRSYYEEVLIVRVHPEYLAGQRLGRMPADLEDLWNERYASIRDHELHLARNGTVVLKFWLNVSYDEQRERFLARIDDPEKHWKFAIGDVEERRHWKDYMKAYERALNETSRPHAPWYAIPADDKAYARLVVATLIADTLDALDLRPPESPASDRKKMLELRQALLDD